MRLQGVWGGAPALRCVTGSLDVLCGAEATVALRSPHVHATESTHVFTNDELALLDSWHQAMEAAQRQGCYTDSRNSSPLPAVATQPSPSASAQAPPPPAYSDAKTGACAATDPLLNT